MSSMNRVQLLGNLTRDPQARRLSAGQTVGDLSLAVSESYRGKDGEQKESTCFVDVVVWNKQAEVCETYLNKGSSVLIEGRLQFEEWTDKEGQKRNKLRVKADRLHFMSRPGSEAGNQGTKKEEPVPA